MSHGKCVVQSLLMSKDGYTSLRGTQSRFNIFFLGKADKKNLSQQLFTMQKQPLKITLAIKVVKIN
jgi:hypothetical protein